MTTAKASSVIQKIASYAASDGVFRSALSVSPAHAVRLASWLSQDERRAINSVHLDALATFVRPAELAHAQVPNAPRTGTLLRTVGVISNVLRTTAIPRTVRPVVTFNVVPTAPTLAANPGATLPVNDFFFWEQAHSTSQLVTVTETQVVGVGYHGPVMGPKETWNAGCVRAVVVDAMGNTIVAADTGGLWLVTEDGETGSSIADLPDPDINALALGPDGIHIIAGGNQLYENNPTSDTPLTDWSLVQSNMAVGRVNSIAIDGPSNMVFIATNVGLFFAPIPATAAANRTYNWTPVGYPAGPLFGLALGPPQAGGRPGVVTSTFPTQYVPGNPSAQIFFGTWSNGTLQMSVATVYNEEGSAFSRYSPEQFFSPEAWPTSNYTSGNPSQYLEATTEKATATTLSMQIGTISIASYGGNRATMFAALSDNDGVPGRGYLMAVLKSSDGGQTWVVRSRGTDTGRVRNQVTDASQEPFEIEVVGPSSTNLRAWGDNQGATQGRPGNCIAVSEVSPEVVAIGWRNAVFISPDSGYSWYVRPASGQGNVTGTAGATDPGLHQDTHCLLFRRKAPPYLFAPMGFPSPDGGTSSWDVACEESLYVGSDGGLISTDDYGEVWNSLYNKRLLNHQFMCPTGTRGTANGSATGWSSYGTLGASADVQGLFAGGTQDNGVLYWVNSSSASAVPSFPLPDRVQQIPTDYGNGDGYFARFLPSVQSGAVPIIYYNNYAPSKSNVVPKIQGAPGQMVVGWWANSEIEGGSIIPVQGFSNTNTDCADAPNVAPPSATPNESPEQVSPTTQFFRNPVAELVRYSSPPAGERVLYAVAGGLTTSDCGSIGPSGNTEYVWIYGLYGPGKQLEQAEQLLEQQLPLGLFAFETQLQWVRIGTVPLEPPNLAVSLGLRALGLPQPTPNPPPNSEQVSAIACWNGVDLYVGTSQGRLFHADLGDPLGANFDLLEVPFPWTNGTGGIGRIVVDPSGTAYAITSFLNFAQDGYNAPTYDLVGMVLLFDGIGWQPTSCPWTYYYSLEVDDEGGVYAITDWDVLVSGDRGGTWLRASGGLPQRPHCADIKFVRYDDGSGSLFLSTYGRSVWRAKIGAPTSFRGSAPVRLPSAFGSG